MAAGSSAPELATSVIAVFVSRVNISKINCQQTLLSLTSSLKFTSTTRSVEGNQNKIDFLGWCIKSYPRLSTFDIWFTNWTSDLSSSCYSTADVIKSLRCKRFQFCLDEYSLIVVGVTWLQLLTNKLVTQFHNWTPHTLSCMIKTLFNNDQLKWKENHWFRNYHP